MTQAARTIVFLVGCPRSGTTLLQSLLGCSPDIATFRESHLFSRGLIRVAGLNIPRRRAAGEVARFWRDNALDPDVCPMPRGGMDLISAQRSADAFIAALLQAGEIQARPVVLEKTPRHLHFMDPIAAACRRAGVVPQFIHILREGVEVAASLQAASQHWRRQRKLEDILGRWQRDCQISAAHLGQDGHAFTTYQRLTTAPEVECLQLARATGIRLSVQDFATRQDRQGQIVRPDEIWKVESPDGTIAPSNRTPDYIGPEKMEQLRRKMDPEPYLKVVRYLEKTAR